MYKKVQGPHQLSTEDCRLKERLLTEIDILRQNGSIVSTDPCRVQIKDQSRPPPEPMSPSRGKGVKICQDLPRSRGIS